MILEKLKGSIPLNFFLNIDCKAKHFNFAKAHTEKIIFYEVTSRHVMKFSAQLGSSLKHLFKMNNYSFSVRTVCNVGISMVKLLKEKPIFYHKIIAQSFGENP